MDNSDEVDLLRARFEAAGQGHVFERLGECTASERAHLVLQMRGADLSLCRLALGLIAASERFPESAQVSPIEYVAAPSGSGDVRWQGALAVGHEAMAAGRVGAFLAAGGQGTRLGFEGPKGTFPFGPVTGRSLFSIFAESIAARSRRSGARIPLAVMTSPENDESTREFFARSGFFGLSPDDVGFFRQSTVPSFDRDGLILMESKCAALLSPDGHGGALKILTSGGAGRWFSDRGADVIYYFQVDNPGITVSDPGFIGHHLLAASRFTTKVVAKTGPEERMGVFAVVDGKTRIVEYIHLPPEMAAARDGDGRLKFWAGNVAVHAIDLPHLLERFPNGVPLPCHVARKTARALAPGGGCRPTEVEAHKIETFIFDVIPMLDRVLAVECLRADEFAPVKSSSGQDTPENARKILVRRAARWLEAAGARVPRDAAGEPVHPIEISPLTALEPADLPGKLPDGFRVTGPTVL